MASMILLVSYILMSLGFLFFLLHYIRNRKELR